MSMPQSTIADLYQMAQLTSTPLINMNAFLNTRVYPEGWTQTNSGPFSLSSIPVRGLWEQLEESQTHISYSRPTPIIRGQDMRYIEIELPKYPDSWTDIVNMLSSPRLFINFEVCNQKLRLTVHSEHVQTIEEICRDMVFQHQWMTAR